MISFETKSDLASSSPLKLSGKEEEPKLSFSELLSGAGKKDAKVIQNGALILSLDKEVKVSKGEVKTTSKSDSLLSLLKNEDSIKGESKEIIELNPKHTVTLDTKELKTLISSAKEYLKDKILSSDGYKKIQNEELPKTLKGLATLAKNVGIDISKISIEEIKLHVDTMKDNSASSKELLTKNTPLKDTLHVETKASSQMIQEDKKAEPLKQTPLFKAQKHTEHTTEQIVSVKQFKVDDKTPKEKADDTLKLLLRGEKPSQANTSLTAEFSVATAKVLAPSALTDVTRSLESLLKGEQNESSSTTTSKTDGLTAHKSDSFEVKLNEAKQMIKYISQDVKNAIQDYKSPFTRIKVQLNPQKLGEVDLTIVQRGKNLHVNISSNNSAINTLSMNANELRAQLSNNGINNATLNFNNQQDSNQNTSSQQQNRQNERKADEEYNYYNEEDNEEIISSLEIVVPNYA